MQYVLRIVCTLLTLAVSQSSFANDVELTVWGLSHHVRSPPHGRVWNEVNPGAGMRVYLEPRADIEPFVEADYIVHNSKDGSLVLVGGGAQYPLLHTHRVSVVTGVVLGVVRYENTWTKEVLCFLGGYPFVGVRRHSTTMSLGYIPEIRDEDGGQGGVFILSLGFRL